MSRPRAEQSYAPHEQEPSASRAADSPLADRLARALDVDDVVTVVGLLTLTEDRRIAALPPAVLDRLHESTVREIARARDAKRAAAEERPAPR